MKLTREVFDLIRKAVNERAGELNAKGVLIVLDRVTETALCANVGNEDQVFPMLTGRSSADGGFVYSVPFGTGTISRELEELAEKVHSESSAKDNARWIVNIPPEGIVLEDVLGAMERAAIVEALRLSGGVQKKAARLLGMSPRVMNYKIKTLGIEFPRGK